MFELDGLTVRTSSADVIFVMKLYRAEPQDREDLIVLWPLCGFVDADDAARAFRDAYPHAPDGEYLASYIEEVIGDAR